MFYYARADTHFLLYIYDNMRNELIDRAQPGVTEQNCIELVLQKSKETSLLRYERQTYNAETGKGPGGWYQLLAKTPALLSSEQLAVFRVVHEWRDRIARVDDDSTAFVMSNHVIFSIAKLMPKDMVALLAITHPISYSVKSRSGELLELIKSAQAQGKQGPSMMDMLRPDSANATAKANQFVETAKSTSTPLVAIVDENHLIKEQSSFWGNAFGSSIWDAATPTKQDNDLRLAVPLPQLSAEVYVMPTDLADRSIEKREPQIQGSQPTSPALKDSNETFVLKRGARQRRDPQSEPEDASNSQDAEADESKNLDAPEETVIMAERRAAKKLRKDRKKAKQAESKVENNAKDVAATGEEVPFDYSKAESVLHGKRKSEEQNGAKSKKPFDPYAKSADAPKGMRRLQTERAGKSHTFKS
jgi:exosome complex exonuclease RRP6